MKITFYGHATFGVEIGGKHLLFDPFISPNEKAAHIQIDEIPADYILLSHGHQDHVADVDTIGKRTGATVVSNFEIASYYGNQGHAYHPMNTGGSWNFDFGKVTCVNAIHSSVLPDGTYAGNPMGFVVQGDGKTFYYSGDTALTYDMKLLADRYQLDFAFLCMGDNFTMGVEDAVIASEFINCSTIFGMHFDTFGYIVIDHEMAKKQFADKGKKLHLLAIGDTTEL